MQLQCYTHSGALIIVVHKAKLQVDEKHVSV